MRKITLIIVALFATLTASAQITDTATLRNYITANIVPNGNRAITATILNNSLIGILNVSNRYSIDSMWVNTAMDTLFYTKGDAQYSIDVGGTIYNRNGTLTGDRNVTIPDNGRLNFVSADANRFGIYLNSSTASPEITFNARTPTYSTVNNVRFTPQQVLMGLTDAPTNTSGGLRITTGSIDGYAGMSWSNGNANKSSTLGLDSSGAYLLRTYYNNNTHHRLILTDSVRGLQYQTTTTGANNFVTKASIAFNGSINVTGIKLSARIITASTTATDADYTIINAATTGNPTITLSGSPGTIYVLVEEAANPTANGMNWTPAITYKGSTYTNTNNAELGTYSRLIIQNVDGTWYLIGAN